MGTMVTPSEETTKKPRWVFFGSYGVLRKTLRYSLAEPFHVQGPSQPSSWKCVWKSMIHLKGTTLANGTDTTVAHHRIITDCQCVMAIQAHHVARTCSSCSDTMEFLYCGDLEKIITVVDNWLWRPGFYSRWCYCRNLNYSWTLRLSFQVCRN